MEIRAGFLEHLVSVADPDRLPMDARQSSPEAPKLSQFETWDATAAWGSVRHGNLPKSNSSVPDDLRKIFGQNVRAARIKAGLMQAQLAKRTGLTQQYVSLIEAGHQNVTLDTMAALARAVGRDVSALLRKARNRIRPR